MDFADEFQSSSSDPRTVGKTYLFTYSQANRISFSTRESFSRVFQMPSIKDQVK